MNAHGALTDPSRPEVEEGIRNREGEEGKEQGDRNREAPADPVDVLIALTRTLVTFATSRDGDDEVTPTVEELITEHGLDPVEGWLTSRPSHTRYRYARDLAFALRRDLTVLAEPTRPMPKPWTPPPALTAEEQVEADRAFAELLATHRRKDPAA